MASNLGVSQASCEMLADEVAQAIARRESVRQGRSMTSVRP